MTPELLRHKLDRLRTEYLCRLPAKLLELGEAIEKGPLPLVQRLAHALQGTLSCYGLEEIAVEIRAIDELLESRSSWSELESRKAARNHLRRAQRLSTEVQQGRAPPLVSCQPGDLAS